MSVTATPGTTGTGTTYQAQPSSTAAPPAASTTEVSKNMFLQLLVAQLKNQNPLNPTDSTAFVGQLAQFQQLETSMNSAQDIAAMRTDLDTLATAKTSTQSGS